MIFFFLTESELRKQDIKDILLCLTTAAHQQVVTHIASSVGVISLFGSAKVSLFLNWFPFGSGL